MSQLVDKLKAKGKIKRTDIAGIHNKHFINLINNLLESETSSIEKENTFTLETIQP